MSKEIQRLSDELAQIDKAIVQMHTESFANPTIFLARSAEEYSVETPNARKLVACFVNKELKFKFLAKDQSVQEAVINKDDWLQIQENIITKREFSSFDPNHNFDLNYFFKIARNKGYDGYFLPGNISFRDMNHPLITNPAAMLTTLRNKALEITQKLNELGVEQGDSIDYVNLQLARIAPENDLETPRANPLIGYNPEAVRDMGIKFAEEYRKKDLENAEKEAEEKLFSLQQQARARRDIQADFREDDESLEARTEKAKPLPTLADLKADIERDTNEHYDARIATLRANYALYQQHPERFYSSVGPLATYLKTQFEIDDGRKTSDIVPSIRDHLSTKSNRDKSQYGTALAGAAAIVYVTNNMLHGGFSLDDFECFIRELSSFILYTRIACHYISEQLEQDKKASEQQPKQSFVEAELRRRQPAAERSTEEDAQPDNDQEPDSPGRQSCCRKWCTRTSKSETAEARHFG